MVTRRKFLVAGAGLMLAAGAALNALRNRLNRYRLKTFLAAYVVREPRLDTNTAVGALSEQDMATVLALSEILLPATANAEALALVQQHVTSRTQRHPGYLQEYQRAAQLLDEVTHRRGSTPARFSELPAAERERTLRSLLWAYRGEDLAWRYAETLLVPKRVLSFRRFVVSDILVAFYQSSYGWAIVGYSHYPGIPAADPRDYTRPVTT